MSSPPNSIAHRLLSLSIGKKFLLATKLSSFITLSVFSVIYVIQEKKSFLQKKTDLLISISQIVTSNSEAALSFDDPITAEDYLNSLKSEPDITQASIFDRDDKLFAQYQSDRAKKAPSLPDWEGSRIGANSIEYSQNISILGEKLGTLLIEADTSSLAQTIQEAALKAAGAIALGMLFSLGIATLMQRLITRPLFELKELAKNVTNKNDYSQRATKRYDDEVGSLVDSLNTMMRGIQERDQAITNHSHTLEEKVSQRTAELEAAVVQAQAASKAKSEFLSTMSHELRTPLNAIVGMSGIVAAEDLSPELADHVRIIQTSSDSLLSIINQILDYSKIESGNLELEEREFNITDCLEESIDMISSLHWNKPVDFFVTIDPSLPHSITGDITRLRQAIVNLLGNAAKFTKQGHVWLEAKAIRYPDNIDTLRLQISVHDSGIGIPEDRIGKLFKSFSQIDSSTTREFGGTGLGLAITQKLINAMGGEIEVSSIQGQGSSFTFDLPIPGPSEHTIGQTLQPTYLKPGTSVFLDIPFAPLQQNIAAILQAWGLKLASKDQAADFAINSKFYNYEPSQQENDKIPTLTLLHPQKQEAARSKSTRSIGPLSIKELRNFVSPQERISKKQSSQKNAETNSPLPGSETRILLAEDNRVNQKVFRLIMKREGYNIDVAENGREAVAAQHKAPYQIIFMDLQMPEMDGLEACRQIRSSTDFAQPWIIGFTANVESDAEPAMREAGMNDYIAKPVRNERVRQALSLFETNSQTQRN